MAESAEGHKRKQRFVHVIKIHATTPNLYKTGSLIGPPANVYEKMLTLPGLIKIF